MARNSPGLIIMLRLLMALKPSKLFDTPFR